MLSRDRSKALRICRPTPRISTEWRLTIVVWAITFPYFGRVINAVLRRSSSRGAIVLDGIAMALLTAQHDRAEIDERIDCLITALAERCGVTLAVD